jgi:ribulose-bisphosphate carboxylase small chain
MRIKQGTFSTLPDLTDDEIKAQIQYCIDQEWAVSVEFTDDPHPRNIYWELWGMPMFDTQDASACFTEVAACREAYPKHYIKVNGYNARYTKQTIGLSFMVNRPETEPGFRLDRTELNDRHIAYTMHSYAAEVPHGTRYQGNGSGPEPD